MEPRNDTGPEFPFRGGISNQPYSDAPWIIGQYSGFSDPESTNRRYRDLIEKGQQGLAIALDLPTQLGLDPDDARSRGEVGRVGVGLSHVGDLEDLFDGIPLDAIRQISTTANSIGPMMIGLFLALAQRRGVDPRSFSLRLQNDVLKEYVARGTQIYPVSPALRLAVDAIEYCAEYLPEWVPMSISGYHMRDAGASRERELGFTLANARAYFSELQRRGVDIVPAARSVTWFLSASGQPIEEAAKFRAARELWATTMADDFGVRDEEALKLRIIAYTLGSELSAQEILNNSVRVTLSALGAVFGGVQVLFCSSIDEAHGLPSDEHALLSLRTQQILLRESGLADHVDILGGSSVLESQTDSCVSMAREIDATVQSMGGSAPAIESGWMRQQIDDDAWQAYRNGIEKVGTSEGIAGDAIDIFEVSSDSEAKRIEACQRWKSRRDGTAVDAALAELEENARGTANLVEPVKKCFTSGATLGEVAGVLSNVFGSVSPDREV